MNKRAGLRNFAVLLLLCHNLRLYLVYSYEEQYNHNGGDLI